ncbi:glycoside hydrolase family 95 protein [Olivibacter sp. CPCC 100613]|uniref:glycoside hydrolase family 95 protein n=1 Tax=Olivibacter sp. CPCC 100613 TaxID=3079931 RepID=UPI002FFA82D1
MNGKLFGQDLALWYQQPASTWTEALPIGNGKLGAMVFGGVQEDRIQFNESSLWTGGPRNYNLSGAKNYLGEIRKLLAEGKQQAAEELAGRHFMGTQSEADPPEPWLTAVRTIAQEAKNPSQEHFDDRAWKKMKVPTHEGWEKKGFQGLDGAVWFRTSFSVPKEWIGRELVIDLGKIRDQDFSYVNGKLIGTTHDINQGRQYTIPKELVKEQNHLAIQVINYDDKGGLVGYKDLSRKLRVFPKGAAQEQAVYLADTWKYWIQNDDAPRVGKYQASYQPFGDLLLQFKQHHTFTDYKRTLDLEQAICRTSYQVGDVHFERTYLSSAVDSCLAIHLTADQPHQISFIAFLESPHKAYQISKVDDSTLRLSVQVKHGVLKGEGLLHIRHKGGEVHVKDGKIELSGADEASLFLTAATNYKSYNDVSAKAEEIAKLRLNAIERKSYEVIRNAHVRDYQQYFSRFSLHFGTQSRPSVLPTDRRIEQFAKGQDPNLLALFAQYGRYLLISSSRPGGLAPNLQGIWNDLLTPPWGSKYTTNINAEMNYWLAENTNLSALQEPLFQMIKELSVTGHETAKTYYDALGWVLHHNTDLWRGTAPINNPNHGIWVTGGAWLCQHLWEHFLFTQDERYLREEAYPIMKAAALFFDQFLIPDARTGWLISSPSNSPEQGGLVAGPTMDHQLIRQLFTNVIAATDRLGIDEEFAQQLSAKRSKIAPNQIGKYGQLQEWLEDIDDPANKHRHVSHLWAVYPGSEINWQDSPQLMNAAKKSLIFRGDGGTGWSLAWKINLWARFKDAEHAYKMISTLLSPEEKGGGVYPNLFDAHPPFQIDGNFGGAAGLAEMLIQSHLGTIDILPALPKALADGAVKGICARGGFELSYQWKNGLLTHLDVRSDAGGMCSLRYQDKTIQFQTEKGQTYQLDNNLKLSKNSK